MKKTTKITGILTLLSLFVLVCLTAMPSVTATDYRDENPTYTDWTDTPPNFNARFLTDTTFASHKGAMPMIFVLYNNVGPEQTIKCQSRIVGYNSTTWVTGWKIDVIQHNYPGYAFSSSTSNCLGEGVWGTYKDSFLQSTNTMSDGVYRAWGTFIDIPDNTTQTSIVVELNLTNVDQAITTTENVTINIVTNASYNIKLYANALKDTIQPEETLEHQFNLQNLGTKTVDIGLSYTITVKDSDGDALSNTGWELSFKDYAGLDIVVYRNVESGDTVHPSFVLTAPEKEDAPAGATVEITIMGHVANNTKYSSRFTVGDHDDEDIKTSDEFEGEDADGGYAWWVVPLVWGVIILGICTVIGLMFMPPKMLKGRSGRRKNRD